jgi:hypothetical protein
MMPLHTLLAFVAAAAAAAPVGGDPSPPVPVDASLTVRLAAGKSVYALGELIPLELEFRGRADADYYLSTGMYDRSGRTGVERYAITPAGGSDDPLAEFFSSVGIVGGGFSGWQPLDGSPLVLRVHLNDWVRFTRPGDYRLVVSSSRLERNSRRPVPPVVSEPVALRIAPSAPDWAGAEAARAVADVESGRPERLRHGVTILRHLGTREAALALVRHYGVGGDALRFDVQAGLVASPYRADVVKAMEARVGAGEGLPAGFVRDLALLRSLLERPSGTGDAGDRFDRQKAIECAEARRWIAALAKLGPSAGKLGAALTTLMEPPDAACETGLGALLAGHPAAAREAFLALPATTQRVLLEYRWEAAFGPWVKPALEALYGRWAGDSRFAGAGDLALRRIVELDPGKGRSLVLEEIRNGAHGLAADTLMALVDGPLPGLDDALRERYQAADSGEGQAASMWLVARFGSAALAPFVRAELDRDSPCELEAAAIAYLLTHDPPTALGRLQPGFDRSRPGTCVVPPWAQLAPRHWDDRVEDAAIAHLGGGDPRLVSVAVQTLGAFGSARVKEPLTEHLGRWAAEWRGREEELDARWLSAPQGPSSPDSPAIVENALVNALFENPRMALTATDRALIRALCVTRGCRENVDALVRSRSGP